MPKILEYEIFGARTRAWQYGPDDASALILVHGFRGDHHGLEGLAQDLSILLPQLRVVVPDLPGFGQSDPIPNHEHNLELYGSWLTQFSQAIISPTSASSTASASALAPGSLSILGHSFGSLVVSQALSQGLSPSNTVLINPISSPALDGPQSCMTKLAVAYYQAADFLPERQSRWLLGHPVIVRVMSEFMAKTRDPQLRKWIHGQHEQHFSTFAHSSTLLQAFRASVSHTVNEFAPFFNMPTLFIAGDRDDITPLTEQLSLSRRVANSQLSIMPGVGHLVHYEAVHQAAEEIVSFLERSRGASL